MAKSPVSILFDIDGVPMAVRDGYSPDVSGLVVAGSDGYDVRFLAVDILGRPIITGAGTEGFPAGGVISIQGVDSGKEILVAQSGIWTIQPGNTPNTTPWLASIHDGTNKATVRDLASNDALNVAIVDGSGNQITSFGGGTQYTEDVAAVTDPVGTQLIARRRDSLSSETTDDGDNTAVNSTAKGELYVKHVDAIPVTDNGSSLTIDGTVTIQDGGNVISVDDAGASLTIDNATLSVIGGGAEATALRVTIADDSSGLISVDDNGGSLTVDAVSLPLPTGASTLAEQQTQTTALQLIDDIVHATNAALNKVAAIGGQLDDASVTAATENNVAAVRITAQRALHINLRDNSGTEVGTSGAPIRIDPTGTTAQPVTDNGSSLTIDNTTLSVVGGGAEATALRVTIANDSTGLISIDDNGSSITIDTTQLPAALVGGRLDTNIGAWLGSTAPTVGQKTMANSVPITIASDQSSVPTKEIRSATGTTTTVAASASNVTLLASNANRLGATIFNDSVAANLFVKLGATASATSFAARITPNGYYEVPYNYTGIIDGIWSAASGNARITELT
jgi:hypothetical protein